MSNTVQFQNAYVEVLLDNFMSVVKQNVYLQTQSKVSEEAAKRGEDMSVQANNLADINVSLQQEVESLNETISNLKNSLAEKDDSIARQNYTISNSDIVLKDKNRLQSAVNDYMRQIKKLELENKDLLVENEKLSVRVNSLIAIAPINKVKRLGITIPKDIPKNDDINTVEVEETNLTEVKNGGTF